MPETSSTEKISNKPESVELKSSSTGLSLLEFQNVNCTKNSNKSTVSKSSTIFVHTAENELNDVLLLTKRNVSKELSTEKEKDKQNQLGPMRFYNCKHLTVNINNYSCTHNQRDV